MYGSFGTLLRYGYLPVDSILCYRFRCPSRIVVVPKPVCGCWVLRQFQASLGLAGGMFLLVSLAAFELMLTCS